MAPYGHLLLAPAEGWWPSNPTPLSPGNSRGTCPPGNGSCTQEVLKKSRLALELINLEQTSNLDGKG